MREIAPRLRDLAGGHGCRRVLPGIAHIGEDGRDLVIGTARAKIVKRIVRCAATNVDPATGIRDLNIPQTLMQRLGHADCGVYAEITATGDVAAGDPLSLARA